MSGAFAPSSPGSNLTYETTLTNADLTIANLYIMVHGLDGYPSGVSIWDGDNQLIEPDNVTHSSTTTSIIDLSSYAPLSGTYKISATL